MKSRSISSKILVVILVILTIGIGILILFYNISQRNDIREHAEDQIKSNYKIVYESIKNNMLSGSAPLAIKLMTDIKNIQAFREIILFRRNGVQAFIDDQTLNFVNSYQDTYYFEPKNNEETPAVNNDPELNSAVENQETIFTEQQLSDEDVVKTIYAPIYNTNPCYVCHGSDHAIRGVMILSISLKDQLEKIDQNTYLSLGIFVITVLLLTVFLIAYMRRTVINPVKIISNVVDKVGGGDFSVKVQVKNKDEIGNLASRINEMIKGLYERFKLTKFVSRSTIDMISTDKEILLGGERKELTVLFSDIRGFTSFSENHSPEEVMEVLNIYMQKQAEMINRYQGDIDKFVGDEIMAVFEGEDMALLAVTAAFKTIGAINNLNKELGYNIKIGIGINTGPMIIGNMGSADRIDHTVIGDNVNLGSRLCSAAGPDTVIISESTYIKVKDRVEATAHEPIKVKGKEKNIPIYILKKVLDPIKPEKTDDLNQD